MPNERSHPCDAGKNNKNSQIKILGATAAETCWKWTWRIILAFLALVYVVVAVPETVAMRVAVAAMAMVAMAVMETLEPMEPL